VIKTHPVFIKERNHDIIRITFTWLRLGESLRTLDTGFKLVSNDVMQKPKIINFRSGFTHPNNSTNSSKNLHG
jgi:hypothetical protein